MIKKLFPEYFYHRLLLEIGDERLGLYGNILLLDNPVKSAVKISRRKDLMPDLKERMREWDETIRSGGVLVSPFINPEEKKIRDMAIEAETGIILLVNYRFSDRAKPYKELFDLCSEGRMLIVSTEEYERAPRQISYREAQRLNWYAARIAELAPKEARLRRR